MTIHAGGDLIANRYQIIAYLAEGGMQEVYSALDTVLQKNVALKVPKTASAERRFRQSAILSSRVNHPNAAKTLDYVESGGRPYLIEELITGEDLSRVRERLGLMDPYLVAHLLHHLARGIAASHHADVVHRDLKPSNIMVAPDLSFRFVKITDFGIAKMAEEEIASASEGGEESITGSSTMVGALPYMSPEMIRSPRQTGCPTDVWALGSLAYEMLSGDRPFGKGLAAVPKIVGGDFPDIPAHVTNNAQFSALGAEIFSLIQQCWTMDPASRPSADVIVKQCERLCYPLTDSRVQGIVQQIYHGSWGFIFIPALGAEVFFHLRSVYGPRPSQGDRVFLAAYDGIPKARAHPIVKMRAVPGSSV